MSEKEKNKRQKVEQERPQVVNRWSVRRKTLVLCLVVCLMVVPSAFATSESTGMAAVAAQASTATTWISNVFDMITGNAYLATLMAFGLLAAAIRIFRKAKRAAR